MVIHTDAEVRGNAAEEGGWSMLIGVHRKLAYRAVRWQIRTRVNRIPAEERLLPVADDRFAQLSRLFTDALFQPVALAVCGWHDGGRGS